MIILHICCTINPKHRPSNWRIKAVFIKVRQWSLSPLSGTRNDDDWWYLLSRPTMKQLFVIILLLKLPNTLGLLDLVDLSIILYLRPQYGTFVLESKFWCMFYVIVVDFETFFRMSRCLPLKQQWRLALHGCDDFTTWRCCCQSFVPGGRAPHHR